MMKRVVFVVVSVLTLVLALIVVPVAASSSVGMEESLPTEDTEPATEATDIAIFGTEVPTEEVTNLVTESVTTAAIESTICGYALEEVSTDLLEPTAGYVLESEHIEDDDCVQVAGDYDAESDIDCSDYDRDLLARAIYAEAGCYWIPDEVQLYVGSVILNRVRSGYYPDTIEGVLYDPGQYVPSTFYAAEPDERAYRNADALLSGGSILPADVLGQNGWGIGDGVYDTYYDEVLDTTIYFTYIY